MYLWLKDKLPPTPSKFHYIFTLRDLGRIFEGVCLATPDKFDNASGLVRLWRNELHRIFVDKLIDDADVSMVSKEIKSIITSTFGKDGDEALVEPLVFGDFSGAVERICDGAVSDPLFISRPQYRCLRCVLHVEVCTHFHLCEYPIGKRWGIIAFDEGAQIL